MAELDVFMTLIEKYGLFVALVAYVIWDNRQRESKYQAQQQEFIKENKKREQKYIDREERYISIVESFTHSFENMQQDVSEIKDLLNIKK